MSQVESVEIIRTALTTWPACISALEELHKEAQIHIKLDDRVDLGCQYQKGKVLFFEESPQNPDMTFSLSSESVRQLAETGGDNMAELTIALLRLVAAAQISLELHIGPLQVIRRGYLGIVKKAGPDLMSFLALHGMSSMSKIMGFISQLRQK